MKPVRLAVLAVTTLLGLSVAVPVSARPVPGPNRTGTPAATAAPHAKRLCARPVAPGVAACQAVVRTDVRARKGLQPAAATPNGLAPADLQDAYDLPSGSAGAAQTVAIVDAFDDPNAEADLAVYREQYGLPPCTTDNGCFRKVNQRGETGNYPPPDANWAGEIALDLDMVSAVCPSCHILLVEADDNGIDSLGAAVNEAVALGAKFVSNSYGATEDPSETTYDTFYDHPGVAVTASTGDRGYGTQFPAASPHVTAVGGTSLRRDSSPRGWTESVWSGAGSGCARYEPKPAWQADAGCDHRSIADVSAVADPATGVAVYHTYQAGGWLVAGGTSVAAPIIAATYALAGTPAADTYPGQYVYDGAAGLNDVTTGSNGTCSPAYLCTGAAGYDGPTGLGTPRGVGAFKAVPRGVVTGTVTAAVTGQPIAGATVGIGELSTTTGADGTYRLRPEPGTYDLDVTAFGYQAETVTGVAVIAGQTTTVDVALDAAPSAILRGTVRDGSGQGWPLYARVSVTGTDAVTYTDPATGHYQLALAAGADYEVAVDPVAPGYQRAVATVHLDGDATHDFPILVDAATCGAPGYAFRYDRAHQAFDGAAAPSGWTVSSASPHGWEFDNPGALPNNTGGTGNFAIADPDHYQAWQDTVLTSPAVDLSGSANPVLEWKQDLRMWLGTRATVEVSLDGGPWQAVYAGSPDAYGPETKAIALPDAAGHAAVQARFHFDTDGALFWWEVDDAFLGDRVCTALPGGLIRGVVTDRSTGAGIERATVTVGDQHATTMLTPDDPAVADGYYQLFAPAGKQQLTVSRTGYATARTSVTVVANGSTTADVALRPR